MNRHRSWNALSVESLDRRCLLSAVGSLGGGASVVAAVAHPTARGHVISDITYTHHGAQPVNLDLYLPGGKPPAGGWPVILAFPGGGWRQANRKDYGGAISIFNHYGYAVAGVDYTYASANGGKSWPYNLGDARASVVWVHHVAARFKLNPDKIVAMGESSGGHIALLLGTNPDGPLATSPDQNPPAPQVSSRVAAIVDFYGPTDLTQLYKQTQPAADAYLNTFLGGPPSRYPNRYIDASPVSYVNKSTPPTLIVQGLADPTVVPSQSFELDAALSQAGVPHTLLTVPWARHGFRLNLGHFSFVPDILKFLNGALNNGPIPASRSIR